MSDGRGRGMWGRGLVGGRGDEGGVMGDVGEVLEIVEYVSGLSRICAEWRFLLCLLRL